MNIIITMGGLGTRLRQAGYTIPKYMIQAKEKTLFEFPSVRFNPPPFRRSSFSGISLQ